MMLNKFDIVVILWKIKEYQFGKLGQVNITPTEKKNETK